MSEQSDRVLRLAGEKEVDGSDLLDDTRDFISRFCAFPDEHCLTAVTLWAAHAHIVEHFHTTPRLALLSPEVGSGKTRVLEVLDLLTPQAKLYFSPSSATLFRLLAKDQITILMDECDTIFNSKGKDDQNEDLRALLNSGYKIGATIPRCVGPKHDVVSFEVFAAVALAGLGDLPDTIMSRSVIIRMRRRAPSEKVDPFRSRQHDGIGHALRDRLAGWGSSIGEAAGEAWPELPAGVEDRPAEVWEPLLAVADQAGGHWPEDARAACTALCAVADDRRVSLGLRLLSDLRKVFGESRALYTRTVLQKLVDGDTLDDDAPWADLRGHPLNVRGLATMLRKYDIRPTKVREPGGSDLQGYKYDDLWDAWQRYLPSQSPAEAEHPEQAVEASNGAGFTAPDGYRVDGTAGTYPEHGNGSTARVSPGVPDVPLLRDSGGEVECPRCAGEGCKWCSATHNGAKS